MKIKDFFFCAITSLFSDNSEQKPPEVDINFSKFTFNLCFWSFLIDCKRKNQNPMKIKDFSFVA